MSINPHRKAKQKLYLEDQVFIANVKGRSVSLRESTIFQVGGMPIRDAQIGLLTLGKQLWLPKDRQLKLGGMYLEGGWLSCCKTLIHSAVFKAFT